MAGGGLDRGDLDVVHVEGHRALGRHRPRRRGGDGDSRLAILVGAARGDVARLGEVGGRVHVHERAQVGVDLAKRLFGQLGDAQLGEHRDEPAAAGLEDLARDGEARLDAVEREQRLGAALAHRHDDVGSLARVPEHAHHVCREMRHVGRDREDPFVARRRHRGGKPAERPLVRDLVGEHRDVRGDAGLGDSLGAVGHDDDLVARLGDGVDDAQHQRAPVDVEQRLVDAHAHRAPAREHRCRDRQPLCLRGHVPYPLVPLASGS